MLWSDPARQLSKQARYPIRYRLSGRTATYKNCLKFFDSPGKLTTNRSIREKLFRMHPDYFFEIGSCLDVNKFRWPATSERSIRGWFNFSLSRSNKWPRTVENTRAMVMTQVVKHQRSNLKGLGSNPNFCGLQIQNVYPMFEANLISV